MQVADLGGSFGFGCRMSVGTYISKECKSSDGGLKSDRTKTSKEWTATILSRRLLTVLSQMLNEVEVRGRGGKGEGV